jgi:hypothetical protein
MEAAKMQWPVKTWLLTLAYVWNMECEVQSQIIGRRVH